MESQRNNQHRRGSRPSVGYLLFQYQSELTRRHAEPTRLSRTKIHIIDGLVSRTIRQLKHCSVEELQACKRGLVYKEQLRDELRSLRRRRSNSSSSNSSSNSSSSNSCSNSCRNSNSNKNNTSSCAANTSTSASTPPGKAPSTPPKPQRKVAIFGPEIFV